MMKLFEQVVIEFIKQHPNECVANDLANAMKFEIDAAIINLVNRGVLKVGGNWTLRVEKGF